MGVMPGRWARLMVQRCLGATQGEEVSRRVLADAHVSWKRMQGPEARQGGIIS